MVTLREAVRCSGHAYESEIIGTIVVVVAADR